MRYHRHYQKRTAIDTVTIVYRLHAGHTADTHDHDILLGQELSLLLKLLHKDIKPTKLYDILARRLSGELDKVRCVLIAFSYPANFFSTLEKRLEMLAFEQVTSVCD